MAKKLSYFVAVLCILSSCSALDRVIGPGGNTPLAARHTINNRISTPFVNSTKPNLSQWRLAFDEEFTAPYLNTAMWNIQDDGIGRYHNCCLSVGTGTQYFTSRALSLQNGILTIASNQESMGDKSYTSGAMTTENKYNFLYGDVEIRARLPKGQGMWPALWMLTPDAKQETDIMEMVNDPNSIYQTYHKNIPMYNSYAYQCNVKERDLSTDFHVYTLEWNYVSITWYIDGMQTCQSTINVPQTPMYLLLDTAVGGDWPGPPDASTVFPQYTYIDYIRVYQPPRSMACTGLLVTSPLQIAKPSFDRGDIIHGSVTYTNWCTTPFAFSDVIIAVRRPDGGGADFGNQGAVTLRPGQSITINASRIIQFSDPIGKWYAFSSFLTPDGQWHGDGTNIALFTVIE